MSSTFRASRSSFAKSNTGMAVNPIEVVADTYPFQQLHNGILIDGSVVSISANESLGNIIVQGSIGTVTANADRKNTSGKWSFTDIFARRDGRWVAVASHTSEIAPLR